MPLRELIYALNPPPPKEVLEAAQRLRYRDYLTVVLIVDRDEVFPDNWIYIHDPSVKMGRIQNYKNWSPEMVPDSSKTSLGLEYFLWEQENEWSWEDQRLIELGRNECEKIGIISAGEVSDGTVVRMKKAYPVYDAEYHDCVEVLRDYMNRFANLQTVGRNGLHRYNNQDHSMMTGVLAARNIISDDAHDVWAVNTEKEYHEEAKAGDGRGGDRLIPKRVPEKAADLADAEFAGVFARLDSVALGAAVGLTFGLIIFAATAFLLLKGGDLVGPNLALLGQYLYGYTVSWPGALLGMAEAGVLGFFVGYFVALTRNAVLRTYLYSVRRRVEIEENPDLLEKV